MPVPNARVNLVFVVEPRSAVGWGRQEAAPSRGNVRSRCWPDHPRHDRVRLPDHRRQATLGRRVHALNILWAVVFVVTPGLFQPLEQEVGRALVAPATRAASAAVRSSSARPTRTDARDHRRRRLPRSVPADRRQPVQRQGTLMIGLIIAIVCYYIAFITRHALGQRAVRPLRSMLGTEGTVRIIFCSCSSRRVDLGRWYGVALALPPAVAVLVSHSRPARARHTGTRRALLRALGRTRAPARRFDLRPAAVVHRRARRADARDAG